MVTTKVGRFIVGFLFITGLLVLPTVAAAQNNTFVIPFARTGIADLDAATGLPDPLDTTAAFNNPCTEQYVDVEGTSTITTNQTVLANGDLRIAVSVVTKGTGAGWDLVGVSPNFAQDFSSGTTYAFRDTQQFSIRKPSLGGWPVDTTFMDKFMMRGAQSTDNWVARAHFRLRIDAAGVVRIDFVKATAGDICRG